MFTKWSSDSYIRAGGRKHMLAARCAFINGHCFGWTDPSITTPEAAYQHGDLRGWWHLGYACGRLTAQTYNKSTDRSMAVACLFGAYWHEAHGFTAWQEPEQ